MAAVRESGRNQAKRRRRERQPVGDAPRAHVEPARRAGQYECADPLCGQDAHMPPPTGSAGSQRFQTAALKPL